jgi:hypothetical protein
MWLSFINGTPPRLCMVYHLVGADEVGWNRSAVIDSLHVALVMRFHYHPPTFVAPFHE